MPRTLLDQMDGIVTRKPDEARASDTGASMTVEQLAKFAPYTAAEVRAGAWRDVHDEYWELANQAELAEPGNSLKQRLKIIELMNRIRSDKGLPPLG